MANELDNVKINELPQASSVDTNRDYLPIVHYSESYQTGKETVKVHPNTFNVYNNSKSKLRATTFQDAIDELAGKINGNGLHTTEVEIISTTYEVL